MTIAQKTGSDPVIEPDPVFVCTPKYPYIYINYIHTHMHKTQLNKLWMKQLVIMDWGGMVEGKLPGRGGGGKHLGGKTSCYPSIWKFAKIRRFVTASLLKNSSPILHPLWPLATSGNVLSFRWFQMTSEAIICVFSKVKIEILTRMWWPFTGTFQHEPRIPTQQIKKRIRR